MDPNIFPTKGNLLLAKKSFFLARIGYELMDKKRNILIRELMELIEMAKSVQSEIDKTFPPAYAALQRANIQLGLHDVAQLVTSVPIENSVTVKTRSVMGTEIPFVEYDKTSSPPPYPYYSTVEALDEAKAGFEKVKDLTIRLSMIESSAYRLASSIKKTQKRANALKNITIPNYENRIRTISDILEEKDREEFTRLKQLKKTKEI
ncbi:V-type ATP synthase subunit D [Clostridia bacterium]|nr:V-type ATP synthase subunit D [Clostridia bacterium]